MNELPCSASASETACSKRTSPVALPAGDDHLARLVLSFRQVAAEHDLLRAAGQVRQLFGIDPRHAQARNSTLRSRSAGPGDFLEQVQGDRPGALLAADLPHRAAAQRRRWPSARPTRSCCPRRRRGRRFPCRRHFSSYSRRSPRPSRPGRRRRRWECRRRRRRCASSARHAGTPCENALSQIGPAQRRARGQEFRRAISTFFASAGTACGEDPVAIDVAAGQVELCPWASATAARRR